MTPECAVLAFARLNQFHHSRTCKLQLTKIITEFFIDIRAQFTSHVSLERYLQIKNINTQPTPLLCWVATTNQQTNKQTNMEAIALGKVVVNIEEENPVLGKANNS
jgi:hypothetical protein